MGSLTQKARPHMRSLFAASPSIQNQHRKTLNFFAPELQGYDKIFIVSESAIQRMVDFLEKTPKSKITFPRMMESVYPDQNIGQMFSNPDMQNEWKYLVEDLSKNTNFGPAARSTDVGNQKIGFLFLSEKLNTTPELVAGHLPRKSFKYNDLPTSEQSTRRLDTSAIIIAHELGHLHHNMTKGKTSVSSFSGELYADSYAIQHAQRMKNDGIIFDVQVAEDLVYARRLETMHHILSESASFNGTTFGNDHIVTSTGIYDHSVGFSTEMFNKLTEQAPNQSVNPLEDFLRITEDLRNRVQISKSNYCTQLEGGTGPQSEQSTYQNLISEATRINDMSRSIQGKEKQDPVTNTDFIGMIMGTFGSTFDPKSLACQAIFNMKGQINPVHGFDVLIQGMLTQKDLPSQTKSLLDSYAAARNRLLKDPPINPEQPSPIEMTLSPPLPATTPPGP